MVKRQAKSPPKIFGFFAKFGRLFLLMILALIGLAVVSLVLLSQIETKLVSKNIVFVPPKKSGGESPILLASIDGNSQKIFVYQISGGLKASVMGGYGEYPLNSVQPLLKLEKKEPLFIQAAFSHVLQHSVTEVYEYQPESEINQSTFVKLLLKQRQTWPLALQIYKLGSVHFSYAQISSWEEWEKALSNQLIGKINDHCSVAVVNATTNDGLASGISKILEKSGVEVVRTTDSIWDEPKTALYQDVDPLGECQPVLDIIQSVSPIKLIKEVDATKPTQYRAKIVLFIGNELAEALLQK